MEVPPMTDVPRAHVYKVGVEHSLRGREITNAVVATSFAEAESVVSELDEEREVVSLERVYENVPLTETALDDTVVPLTETVSDGAHRGGE